MIRMFYVDDDSEKPPGYIPVSAIRKNFALQTEQGS